MTKTQETFAMYVGLVSFWENGMLLLKKHLKSLELKNFLMLIVAGIINAFGVTIFLYPVVPALEKQHF